MIMRRNLRSVLEEQEFIIKGENDIQAAQAAHLEINLLLEL
jgi:hypothetical protein